MTRGRIKVNAAAQEAIHSKSPAKQSKQRIAASSSPRKTTSPSKEETKSTKATTKKSVPAKKPANAPAATKQAKPAAAKSPLPTKSRAVKKSPIRTVGRRSASSSAVNKISLKSESDTTIYKEGSYVCFVNGADKKDDAKWDRFCIGKVSNLLRFTERLMHFCWSVLAR